MTFVNLQLVRMTVVNLQLVRMTVVNLQLVSQPRLHPSLRERSAP